MNSVWIFTHGYPTKDDPQMAFLKPVVNAWADLGVRCTVVAPQSLTNAWYRKKLKRPTHWVDTSENGKAVEVRQPYVLTLGRRKLRGVSFSAWMRVQALRRELRRSDEKPDVIYAHFWHCGIEAAAAARDIPVVVANGESEIWVRDECGKKLTEQHLQGIKGVVGVSKKCLDESERAGLFRHKPRTVLLPNGYQRREFYPIDQAEARKKLGVGLSERIAAFVGQFSDRKGVLRVVEAAQQIPELKLILIGSGNQKPVSDQILLAERVPHQQLVDYLNAADFFVLPTLAEGCCNAIIEAMACGLPIISSDRDFNDDLLDETNSIRIDPTDIGSIADAMKTLYEDDEMRKRLSAGALKKAEGLQIEKRAEKILAFMEKCISE